MLIQTECLIQPVALAMPRNHTARAAMESLAVIDCAEWHYAQFVDILCASCTAYLLILSITMVPAFWYRKYGS
jgi:hypothetical protein